MNNNFPFRYAILSRTVPGHAVLLLDPHTRLPRQRGVGNLFHRVAFLKDALLTLCFSATCRLVLLFHRFL